VSDRDNRDSLWPFSYGATGSSIEVMRLRVWEWRDRRARPEGLIRAQG